MLVKIGRRQPALSILPQGMACSFLVDKLSWERVGQWRDSGHTIRSKPSSWTRILLEERTDVAVRKIVC